VKEVKELKEEAKEEVKEMIEENDLIATTEGMIDLEDLDPKLKTSALIVERLVIGKLIHLFILHFT
jgi:hypothetical protein